MSAEHLYLEKTKDRDPLRKCNKILNSRNSYEKIKMCICYKRQCTTVNIVVLQICFNQILDGSLEDW